VVAWGAVPGGTWPVVAGITAGFGRQIPAGGIRDSARPGSATMLWLRRGPGVLQRRGRS